MGNIDTTNVLKVCLNDGLSNPAYLIKAVVLDKRLHEYMIKYSKHLYEIRKKQESPRNDLLSIIINKLESGGKEFDFTTFASMVFLIFAVTYETNSYSITYLLYQLAVEKEVQQRVRNEILEAMQKNNGQLSADSLSQLDYLDRVLIGICVITQHEIVATFTRVYFAESLRLHTVVPILNRVCAKDYKIPGTNVVIEKNTTVLIPVIAVHNDPELFPDPQKFNPDRFLDPKVRQYTMVYGNGQHYCLGILCLIQTLSNFFNKNGCCRQNDE